MRYTLIVPRQAPIQRGLAQVYDPIRAALPVLRRNATRQRAHVRSVAPALRRSAWPGELGTSDPGHWLRAVLARADISEILTFAQRLTRRVTARCYFAAAFGRPTSPPWPTCTQGRRALGDPAELLHARDTRFGVRDHLGVAGA